MKAASVLRSIIN